jgi:hypothetical protein
MKKLILIILSISVLLACDKITIETARPPLPVHPRDDKPRTPLQVGTIRGYFGDYYRTFTQHVERVQAVDTFANAYYYGLCNNSLQQINLIRCDSALVFEIYIMGLPLDSLPSSPPLTTEYGKFASMQLHSFQNWNWGDPGYYQGSDFYGKSLFITDRTDDILTGTFKGTLTSSTGAIMPVTEGEFKIKIFRKYEPCYNDTIK